MFAKKQGKRVLKGWQSGIDEGVTKPSRGVPGMGGGGGGRLVRPPWCIEVPVRKRATAANVSSFGNFEAPKGRREAHVVHGKGGAAFHTENVVERRRETAAGACG